MRTTLELDDNLMGELLRATGERKKRRAVERAIAAYLDQLRRVELIALAGKMPLDLDWRADEAAELSALRRKGRGR